MGDDRGFTLLEVLVALAILAGGLAAAFQTLGVGLRAAGVAERRRSAAALAENMLAELGRTRPLRDGTSEGDLADGQRWRLVVSPYTTTDSDGPPLLVAAHMVQLEVGRRSDGDTVGLVIQTLMLEVAP